MVLAIRSDRLARNARKVSLKRLVRLRSERHHAVIADDLGRVEQERLIDEVARD